MSGRVEEIVIARGRHVPSVQLDEPARTAAASMTGHRVGYVFVVDGLDVIGIVTKGDIVRTVVAGGGRFEDVLVKDVMSSPVLGIGPDTHVEAALVIMAESGCSHLPIIKDTLILGVISAQDVMSALAGGLEAEISELHQYIGGPCCKSVPRASGVFSLVENAEGRLAGPEPAPRMTLAHPRRRAHGR